MKNRREIFAGEEANVPIAGIPFLDTTYIEVSPEDLVIVATSLLAVSGGSEKKAIEKAYTLITEAHLFSRNVVLWNENVRRHHADEMIAVAMAEVGNLHRTNLLVSVLKKIECPTTNSTDAERLFNRWVKEELRHEDFMSFGPFETTDSKLSATFNSLWQMLPLRKSPSTKAPRVLRKGEHETAPWWTTDDVWWPDPSKQLMETRNDQIYQRDPSNPQSRTIWFRCPENAASLLSRFVRWIKNGHAGNTKFDGGTAISPKTSRRQPKNKESHKFVSRGTKGAERNQSGKFKKQNS